MEYESKLKPVCVRLPDGSILSRADLPPPDTTRWVASRKALVVRGVVYKLISMPEALEMYGLSQDEFMSWVEAMKEGGVGGLKVGGQRKSSR